jgi:tetratricopeptide (TPR) repeat protein
MEHLSERTLGLYAIDPASLGSRAEVEAHLAVCAGCGAALENLRAFESALREPESWAGVSNAPAAPKDLRAFAARAAAEDAEAAQLLEEFKEPAAAARFVWTDIPTKPEYQTGGVARLLCKLANGMCERDPLYALKLAEAATAISTGLPEESYPRRTIHNLRGDAQKEQANAFFLLGRLPQALRAITIAESEYRKLPHESIGLVAVKYIRGFIQYEQEDFEAAERSVHEAAEAALHFGAADRYMSARYLLGRILFDRHEYIAAAGVFESILRYGEEKRDVPWIARASHVLGGCYLELGKKVEASRSLHEALRLYTDLGFGPEVTRTHWTIARLLFAEGNGSQAIYRLRRTIAEFTGYGILTDAALVAVDLAEILHATGRLREIPKVLSSVVQTFTDAGKLTSALAALAYLKEAATAGTMTSQLVAHVRRFVMRAEREPERFFAPPPPPSL